MTLEETKIHCQIPCFASISHGIEKVPTQSFITKIKLMIRRRLCPAKERIFKNTTNAFVDWVYKLSGRTPKSPPNITKDPSVRLQAGDWVRVRPLKEIESTLNHWRQLRGCTFMPDMAEYCGTRQKVLKAMKRFVDERDLRVKKASGIILLEGVMCSGAADFGSCDRCCFYFWREEWLEKTENESRLVL